MLMLKNVAYLPNNKQQLDDIYELIDKLELITGDIYNLVELLNNVLL